MRAFRNIVLIALTSATIVCAGMAILITAAH